MPRVLTALIALVLLAMPTAAMAQAPQTNAPPGNSAIDEYLETVPGATGNRSPRPPAAGGESAAGGSAGGGTLTPAQRQRLEALGPDGRALADAVESTAPARSPAAPVRSTTKSTAEAPAAEGRSPLSGVLDIATGDGDGGGMGALLPAILLGSLLAIVALAVARRRATS